MEKSPESVSTEKQMEEFERERLDLLTGIETAELASKVYEILGAELGCRLAEPNLILLISGMKGHTDIPWVKLDKERIEKLEQVNAQLENLGLRIYYPETLEEESEITSLSIVNFKGIERKSRMTKIPCVPPYESILGDEPKEWLKKLTNSLKEAQEAGKIPKEVNVEILAEGIIFGYPDQAILDYEKCRREGKIDDDLLDADILSSAPETTEYKGAVPEFCYYPEHKDDHEIIEYITKAREILGSFYQTDWFKELSQGQEFQKSRQESMQVEREGLLKMGFNIEDTDKG
ncbi:MAG: hypothetical protein WC242_04420 [Candidatus Paceibacterota bacterium]|jgi:hypothetical protein